MTGDKKPAESEKNVSEQHDKADPGLGELSPEGSEAMGDMTPDEFTREQSGVLKMLREAYSEIIDEPMPDRFMQLLEQLDKGGSNKE